MAQAADAVTLAAGITVSPGFLAEHLELYKAFHRTPELSSQEHGTAAAIERRLDELGIEHFRSGGTGVVGLLRNGEGRSSASAPTPTACRLPRKPGWTTRAPRRGRFRTAAPPRSCTAAATTPTSRTPSPPPRTWRPTVTPGPVTSSSSSNPRRKPRPAPRPWSTTDSGTARPVRRLSWPSTSCPCGRARWPFARANMASLADSWRVTVRGRQAHGSQPEKSIDPIVAAAAMVLRLQTIVSRELSPTKPAVVTVGTFHAGLKENIIPETAEFSLNVRTPDEETRLQVLAAIRRIISGEAAASGIGEPDIEEINRFPRLFNDAGHTERVTAAFREAFGEESIVSAPLGMGSEDAGWLGDAIGVPVVFWAFGAFPHEQFEDGKMPPGNHHPGFAPDAEAALAHGTAAALTALLAYVGR